MSSIGSPDAASMRELARDPDYPARALEVIMRVRLAGDPPQ